jgi:hypothetical protein
MKKRFIYLAVIAFISTLFFSCDDDKDVFESIFGDKVPKVESQGIVSGDYGTLDEQNIGTSEPTISSGDYKDKIILNWEKIEGASFVAIYRIEADIAREGQSIESINYPAEPKPVKIAEIAGDSTTYEDKTPANGAVYYYAIKGISEDKKTEGSPSYFYAGFALATPDNVFAENKESKKKIGISWSEVPGASSYKVFRCEGSADGEYDILDSTLVNYFEDHANRNNPPKVGIQYFYKVQAVISKKTPVLSELSTASNGGEIVSEYACDPPATVSASRATSADSVELMWDNVDGASKYIIYRAENIDDVFQPLGESSEITYSDTTITPGTHYLYTIAAVNSAGMEGTKSLLTKQETADPDNCYYSSEGYALGIPSNTSCTFLSNGSISKIFISWNSVENAEKYKIIFNNGSEDAELISDLTETVYSAEVGTEYADYTFKISAFNVIDESNELESQSTEALTPGNGIPENVAGSDKQFDTLADGKIRSKNIISWDAKSGISYKILRKLPDQNDFAEIASGITSSPYNDTNFPARSYDFYHNLIPSIEQQSGETPINALRRGLSAEYKVLAVYDAENNIVAESAVTTALRMPTYMELFYIMQFTEDCATNKLTNQNDYTSLSPDSESDPGFISGKIDFSVSVEFSGGTHGDVLFEFSNYSDWPGLILNNSYHSMQYVGASDPPGGTNNKLERDTMKLTGLFTISRNCNFILTSGNSVYSGTVKINVSGVGAHTFTIENIDDPNNFYKDYDGTDRCPGGRNASGASGQTKNYDNGTLSKFAVFEQRGNNLGGMTERIP